MEKIKLDSGLKEFAIGGGILRFNPADPNVYARFTTCGEKIREIEDGLKQMKATPICLLEEADRKLKEMLSWVFGGENDFGRILQGVSLLAIGANGNRVIVNLLNALEPIMVQGAKDCARQEVEKVRKGKQ